MDICGVAEKRKKMHFGQLLTSEAVTDSCSLFCAPTVRVEGKKKKKKDVTYSKILKAKKTCVCGVVIYLQRLKWPPP